MPFTYHPPTGRNCSICETLHAQDRIEPVIDTHNGKASAANNFPFHNWYNFVLGYSPRFPEYMLQKETMSSNDLVVDPFMGSGTTLIVCKNAGIPSKGIDANDFMVDAAYTKLNWTADLQALKMLRDELLHTIEILLGQFQWDKPSTITQLSFFDSNDKRSYQEMLERRPKLLLEKYISDKPFVKACLISDAIERCLTNHPLKPFFDLALTAIIVPISNIKYGPGFGVGKIKEDVNVLEMYAAKVNRMITDLESVSEPMRQTPAEVLLGDARRLSTYLEPDSVSLMITSPPYPGDHEYTKHTKLELLFRGYATNLTEFQTIKKRMIRASTTNIYKDDNDREPILNMQSIQQITTLIQERLDYDGATSGFEKLYTKLVWEYFGGMYKMLEQSLSVLRSGGKIALLVSDSHAFKMVHIQTAALLSEIGMQLGYVNPEIILWQNKTSTSHQYNLRENILILQKR